MKNKFQISTKKLEKIIGKKLKRNKKVLGIDLAGRTGWAIIIAKNDFTYIDTGIIDVRNIRDYGERFNYLRVIFDSIIEKSYEIVIEEPFISFNKKVGLLLAKYFGIVYTVANYKRVKKISSLTATSARKKVGIRGKNKKKEGAIKFVSRFIKVKSDDVDDGIILALTGLVKESKLGDFI